MGAPGFMSYWCGSGVLLLEYSVHYAPELRSLVILVIQVDLALIMLSAGFYKLRAGYAQGMGMETGMANPQWAFWPKFFAKQPPEHWTIQGFNQMAWIRATAPDPDVRNGRQAKECATRACELSEWQEPGFLDTLAAACAECGEFDDAVRWQEKAIELAPEAAADEFRVRADLYRGGKPYRTAK